MPDLDLNTIREIIASDPLPRELDARRAFFDRNATMFPLSNDHIVTPVAERHGVSGEWITPPGASNHGAVLFLHGGGFMFGSTLSHRHLAAEIGRLAGLRVMSLDFRQAPEFSFPSPVDDALNAYKYLIECVGSHSELAIVGDSAGGGLAISLLLAIKEAALPQPAAAWVISPWVDLEMSGASFDLLADADPMVSREFLKEIADAYLGDAAPRLALASPVHADLSGLPPILIHVGAREVLLDDAVALARNAGSHGTAARLEIWPEMFHVWHAFHPIFEPARRAVAAGADFVRSAVMVSDPVR